MRQIAPHDLWLGNAGDVRDLRSVMAAEISAVVDLAGNEPPAKVTRELTYCRFPLVDGSENSPWRLRLAIETVVCLLRENVPTLVYCGAGMSRSPAIAAAAIARVQGCSLVDGLAIVTQTGPHDVSPAFWSEVQRALIE